MKRLSAWLPERRWARAAALLLLACLVVERLLLIYGQPDLLHDLDAGELKHMGLALDGLPDAEGLRASLHRWLSGPENVHHGGYPVVSVLFAALAKIFGTSLQTLRLIPSMAAVLAALLTAAWLRRRAGDIPALLSLGLLAGAPLLFLKWTCTARGGHLEAVFFAPLLVVVLDHALRSESKVPWFVAGVVSGFAVYFTYLAVPLVLLLGLGACWDGRALGREGNLGRLLAFVGGGFVGFLPWILGWLLLDLPYLEATIHQSGKANEAGEVHGRGLLATLSGAWTALPHNLWPWSFSEAVAPAYMADPSDLLDFRPTRADWLIRWLILSTGVLGILGAIARRSALTLAFALLPAAHYLFVMRLANPGGWPEIPHRYLVLVFPAAVASSALGVGWLLEGKGRLRRALGIALAAALVGVSLFGLKQHSRWLATPDFEALEQWDVPRYKSAMIGQVRLEEGAEVGQLLSRFSGPMQHANLRGVTLVYVSNADYYLLWRRPGEREAPYPRDIFRNPDPLTTQPGEAEALVLGAYEATLVRSRGDKLQRERWLCSWAPGPQFRPAVEELLAEREPNLRCGDAVPPSP